MTKAELESVLAEIVRDLQVASGRAAPAVGAAHRPILDVDGFDSLNGVEATIELSSRLGQEFDFNNVFSEGSKALSISEAADRVLACMHAARKGG